jgi:hypothetical protein
MGWASGSWMASDIWALVERYIPKNQKKRVAKRIVRIFESQDCDTLADEAEALIVAAGLEDEYLFDEEE